MADHRRAYLEVLPALTLTGLGALAAGLLLGFMTPQLEASPGLLIMIPGLMAMRGNISGSMGSRLGSAVHLGLLDPRDPFGPVAKANVLASIILSTGIGAVVGLVGWAASVALGMAAVAPWIFVAVAVVTALLSSAVLSFTTLFIVLTATRRGLDPDNVTGPVLTTVGDVITLAIIFVLLGVV